ncbi:MAG: hypothetical protein GY861_17000 [bacterium]|nr:hypothetical protein [bacterium]
MPPPQYYRYKIRFKEDGMQDKNCNMITTSNEDEVRSLINYDAEIVRVEPYKGKII